MFGTEKDGQQGLIPRICDVIFDRINQQKDSTIDGNDHFDDAVEFRVEASMIEIYMEQVRDLLGSQSLPNKAGLRIRGKEDLLILSLFSVFFVSSESF